MAMENHNAAYIITSTATEGSTAFIWKLWFYWLSSLRRRHVLLQDRLKLRDTVWYARHIKDIYQI